MTRTEMLETMKRLDAHANALLLTGASDIDLLGGMFDVLRWVPLAGLGFALFYGGWVTYRLVQAERGDGPLCPRCGGPLGFEKYEPYSPHRTCLACGKHVNERYYNWNFFLNSRLLF